LVDGRAGSVGHISFSVKIEVFAYTVAADLTRNVQGSYATWRYLKKRAEQREKSYYEYGEAGAFSGAMSPKAPVKKQDNWMFDLIVDQDEEV
jgi:hypothetical protein